MKNQCDGCKANMPIVDGIHQYRGRNHMVCTKNEYAFEFKVGDKVRFTQAELRKRMMVFSNPDGEITEISRCKAGLMVWVGFPMFGEGFLLKENEESPIELA